MICSCLWTSLHIKSLQTVSSRSLKWSNLRKEGAEWRKGWVGGGIEGRHTVDYDDRWWWASASCSWIHILMSLPQPIHPNIDGLIFPNYVTDLPFPFPPTHPPKKSAFFSPWRKKSCATSHAKLHDKVSNLATVMCLEAMGKYVDILSQCIFFFGQEIVIEHDNAVEPFTKVCFWATNYVPFEQSLVGGIEAKHPHTPPLVVLGETDIIHQIFLLWGMERTCLDIELEFVLAAG